MLIGNLGSDPEVRYMASGDAVTTLRVATSESWKDKHSGEKKEETEWHKVTLFRKLAEIAAEYCKKGSKVYIEGRLKTDKWQDKSGQDRYSTGIIAESMKLLGSKPSAGTSTQSAAPSRDSFDDDIPF